MNQKVPKSIMILMKNLEKQEQKKLNIKLIRIDKAFIIKITIMKDITLRNASCNRSFITFVRMMIITWINALEKKTWVTQECACHW